MKGGERDLDKRSWRIGAAENSWGRLRKLQEPGFERGGAIELREGGGWREELGG
jgi:hypothetical protein